MKADRSGTLSEQIRYERGWRTATQRKSEGLPARLGKDAAELAVLRHGYFNSRTGHLSPMAGKAMSATQQEVDRRWREAVEAAKEEILNGLPLIEYLRRTGDKDVDGWAALLAQFGEE